jgi:hypothetical protein
MQVPNAEVLAGLEAKCSCLQAVRFQAPNREDEQRSHLSHISRRNQNRLPQVIPHHLIEIRMKIRSAVGWMPLHH